MNQFCGMKGIKREFSVSKTPQQNRVAERKNMTLIEAARTMLTDSLLPTTFWAEVVSTACYVHNKVLVTKPHNKTPYELLHGRPPSISFMRPFGCPVTILNTLDPLRKFDEKVTAGNQTNKNACIKDNVDAVPTQQYILLPLLNDSLQSSKDVVSNDAGKKTNEEPTNEVTLDNLLVQQKKGYANSTNRDSIVSPSVSIARQSFTNADDLPTDPLMPDLEDTADLLNTGIFSGAYDDEDVGEEADLSNLETTMNVSPIPTTKIHKDHPKDQIIGDISSATQTRRMTKISEELAMHAIRTKWVYRNKKDERGIVDRNKARLVAQGYTQVEGIDYDEVFAPDARIEAIKLFLAYVSFMGFIVYQMDVKSAFLYGTIEEERDDGIFISQDKYVANILKKFDFVTIKTASTPIETNKALLKDEEAGDVDVYIYRSMIGSLMYLTVSRPDMMFAVCAYARFQVTPKVSHLHDVKRIFRYLKGQPKLGLWYPRDSLFDLEAFSDSDYARSSLDRKSTTREYVAAANCCGQVLWIQNQMLDYGFNFMNTKIYIDNESTIYETVIKKWEDGMERAATTGSSLEVEHDSEAQTRFKAASKQSNDPPLSRVNTLGSGEDSMKLKELMEFCTKLSERALDFSVQYALTVNPTIYTTCIEQFWTFAKAKTVNGECQIQALVDKKKVIITETSIRSDLKLDDAEGTDCLPTAIIFAELERMGAKTKSCNEFSSTMASAIICLATNKNFNFSRYIFDNMVKNFEGGVKFIMYPRFVQVFLNKQVEGMSKHKGIYVIPSYTKKVFANMKRPGNGFSGKVTPLFETMMVQATEDMGEDSATPTDSHSTPIHTQPSSSNPQKEKSRRKQRKDNGPIEPIPDEAINEEHVATPSCNPPQSGEDRMQLTKLMDLCTQLQSRVLALETTKSNQALEIESLKRREDASKQGRKIADLDADEEVSLEKEVAEKEVSDADPVTTAEIKVAKPKAVTSATTTTTTTRPKARGVVVQELTELEEEERISRLKEEKANIALLESWDNTQAMIDVDFQLAQQMKTEEQEQLTQQKALDDALVTPVDRLEFGKCNMRLKTDIKLKEATFQVVLDALALTPFYQAFLITAEFCPKIPGQKFADLPLEHDILSFIRDLGHSRDIIYLSDVSVDYLHQPWREFATIINKCLSGKETGMDKIRLSRAQILWENKEAKNTNKMLYPRFTKIITGYFMSKDQSISRRNKMFWHTARDDTMFTSMRCISGHKDT
ncbi:putative ribonuclease H-like domain-containing protein [Tanacetum coccineum]|uniref:Ribonuclease H-like domain-containing protein n=1 Tax=Tanacetum coccineum TaxID=301880 RepID=A0ABQ4ZWW5_9ASTR